MNTIGHHPVTALFDRVSVRLCENEKARQHRRDPSPPPCAGRLERGLSPSKIRSMGHNANPLLGEPPIAAPSVPGSRSIAPAKSP
ncbi:MAG: hypothetical protein ACLQB4_15070 [Beijerinckiaceae bacterium]